MKQVTFKIERETLEQLDVIAMKKRMYRSEIIRRAIEDLIKEELKES